MHNYKQTKEENTDKNKLFYIYVEYYDDFDGKSYCYTSNDHSIKKDDIVLVKRGQEEIISARVIITKYCSIDNEPYPFNKMKYLIRKLPQFLDDIHYKNLDNIEERIVAQIIDEVKYINKIELKKDAEMYNIDNFDNLTEDEIKDIIIKKERNNDNLDQNIINNLLNRCRDNLNLRLYYNKDVEIKLKNRKKIKGYVISYTNVIYNDKYTQSLLVESGKSFYEINATDIKNINIIKKPVCPNCNEILAEIIYGLPSINTFSLLIRKKAYFSSCEELEDKDKPIYHCYNCNRNYYKDLKKYK